MNIPNRALPRIVVVGSGFAGLKFVKRLDSRYYQIVLIDKNNYHTFQPLLYQVAGSGLEPDSIVYPIRKVFKNKSNFHFRMAEVLSVDPEKSLLQTSIGPLSYDILVLANGAVTNFFGLKNIQSNALAMKTLVQALDLRSIILQNFEEALMSTDTLEIDSLMSFVIVGGGPTGVELAGALAELKEHVLPKDYPDLDIRKMQIHLLEGAERVLPSMSEEASSQAAEFLKRMGVHLWLDTLVKDFDGSVVFTNKTNLNSKNLIWAAGVKAQPVNGLKVEPGPNQRTCVDKSFRIAEYDNIYVIGDACIVQTPENPTGDAMLASVAQQQGYHLATNLNRKAKGLEPRPFKYRDKGTMATIGRNLAVVDMGKIKFSGFLAWLTWMFVHLMLLVDFRSRIVIFVNWLWSYIKYDKGTRLIIRKVKRS